MAAGFPKSEVSSDRRFLALILLFATIVIILPIGRLPVWNMDESRYAEVAREMDESGDYLVPRANGELVPFYPPLNYWLTILSAKAFGGFSEFAVRFPSALSAVGCVLLTFFFGKLFLDASAGFIASLVLMTIFGFVMRVLALADMLMVFFVMLSLYLFMLWRLRPPGSTTILILSYIALGFAVLSKGPQAVVLVGMIVFISLIVRKEFRAIGALKLYIGIPIVIAIALPWYLAVYARIGEGFLISALGENVDNYFSGSMLMHVQPWHYYLRYFLIQPFPWILFAPFGLWIAMASRERREAGIFLTVWIVAILCFYSLATSKRFQYLLPLYPAVALAAAFYWREVGGLQTEERPKHRYIVWLPHALLVLCGLILVAIGIATPADELLAKAPLTDIPATTIVVVGASALALFLGINLFCMKKRRSDIAFSVIVALLLVSICSYLLVLRREPGVDEFRGVEFCRQVRQIVGRERFCSYGVEEYYLSFYTDRTIRRLVGEEQLQRELSSEGRIFLLVDEPTYRDLGAIRDRFTLLLENDRIHRYPLMLLAETRH